MTTATVTTIATEHGNTIAVPGPYGTMADIERKHKGHWFDADTMRWFKTRLPYGQFGVFYGRFFISTEQPPYGPRVASIRYVTDNGDIETLGDFCKYKSPAAARKALNKIVNDAK